MDLRMFYQKMRNVEKEIVQTHVIVVSLQTDDGGRADVQTEVGRESAAKMIVEGRARLATDEESETFREALRAQQLEGQKRQLAGNVNFVLLHDQEIEALRRANRKSQD